MAARMSREVVTISASLMRNEESHLRSSGACSTKPRSPCTGPPISTWVAATSSRVQCICICAITSPSRYSEARLTTRPMLPSSPCWQTKVTPRAKFGSPSAGIAIRKWPVRDEMVGMIRLYATRVRRAAIGCSARLQRVAGQELPGSRDVQLVDLVRARIIAVRNRRKRRGQVHDADRGVVQHLVSGTLDDVDTLDAAVACQPHGQHQLPVQPAPARLVRIIEVAHALDAADPRLHVGGVGVFA